MILFGKHLAAEMERGGATWVKKESSKYPGKIYYFNLKSGESRWESPEEESSSCAATRKRRQNESRAAKLLKVKTSSGVCKSSKTPAQDRLNKLQAKLAAERIKKEKPRDVKLQREENRTDSKDSKAPKNTYQKTKTDSDPSAAGNRAKACTSCEKNEAPKKLGDSDTEVPNCKKAVKRSHGGADVSILAKIPRLTVEALGKIPKLIYDKFSSTTKEKTDFSLAHEAQKGQETQNIVAASTKDFVNSTKDATDSFLATSSRNNTSGDTNDKKIENTKPFNIPSIPPRPFSTARKLGSANDRLTILRKTLEKQQREVEKSNNPSNTAKFSFSSPPLTESNRDYSPMEWEEIQEQINEKITEIRQDNEKEKESSLGDFYNIVNQNLLKLCAEQSNDSFVKGNCFYFVVDTNVFLQNLSFVDDLRKFKFCGTDSSVIVVPYSVLQELDRIKQRSNTAVCTLAVRAIKYLNKRFEEKDERVKGQNAIEANRHLILIENADDNILNCCLQIKAKTDKILLLTNDVNLRNKSMCNGIPVSSKGDLDSIENLSIT